MNKLKLAALGLAISMLFAVSAAAQDAHTSSQFQGPKANKGHVTHSTRDGKSVLTLSEDFVVPDTPDPHWRVLDSDGNVYDLDKLKNVNDTYGHPAGNEVLRILGETISGHVRTEDVPARYGGDEFAIVMPDTPRDEAEKVVERLMVILDRTEVDIANGRSIPMPELSWGIATYPLDGHTARELVENADTRAYARKRSR